MEYQQNKLSDNTSNQSIKFRTKNIVEINDDSRGVYSTNSQIKFKNQMLRSSLCDFSNAYILVKGTVKVPNMATVGIARYNKSKKLISKICSSFTDFITSINNTDVAMLQTLMQ